MISAIDIDGESNSNITYSFVPANPGMSLPFQIGG